MGKFNIDVRPVTFVGGVVVDDTITALVDTGADVSVMSLSAYTMLRSSGAVEPQHGADAAEMDKTRVSQLVVVNATGGDMGILGHSHPFKVKVGNHPVPIVLTDFLISESLSSQMILGRDSLARLNSFIDVAQGSMKVCHGSRCYDTRLVVASNHSSRNGDDDLIVTTTTKKDNHNYPSHQIIGLVISFAAVGVVCMVVWYVNGGRSSRSS